jgi:hypothetical protein
MYNLPMLFQIVQPVCAAVFVGDCVADVDVATITGITCLIGNLLQQIPKVLTLVAVVMVIFAGVRLIGAGADPKAYAAAWATFTYAIIGLILMAVVWLILIVIQNFTGAPVTNFGF